MYLTDAQIEEIDRAARAYGWEIGRGVELSDSIEMSPNNPFMNPNWRSLLPKTIKKDS